VSFKLLSQDPSSRARLGRLSTLHGEVETPIFMPVGTQGTVRTTSPRELEELGADIILGNTYHLNLRPGVEVIRAMGGLHKFMSWNKPILTDSGGFQVFSLAKIRKVRDDGVEFQSHFDGATCFLGPREVVEFQTAIGSDIMMVLDECPPWPASKEQLREAVDRSVRWAEQCAKWKEKIGRPEQELYGIVQGGGDAAMRRECAEKLVAMDFPGYAIGGVSVGEPAAEMYAAVEASVPHLPEAKPRYTMGLGMPNQMVEMVARGVDMFDCVLPTRTARNGTAFTKYGYLHVSAARHKAEKGPIEDGCRCYACQNFSRAYIRHLFNAEEILGLRLVSLHNLCFYLQLMRDIRRALKDGSFAAFRKNFIEHYKEPNGNDS